MPRAYRVEELSDVDQSRAACDRLLSQLPDWFGTYDVYQDYLDDLATRHVFGVAVSNTVVGLMALTEASKAHMDIHVFAVAPAMHGKGVGRALVIQAERFAAEKGKHFLTVKTLGPSHPSLPYRKTRGFYQAVGFAPIEEYADFWGKGYPMLLLCKSVKSSG